MNTDLITIDGSMGEGGGQILRSCLSLALCTGRPVRITNIRKARKRPGLARQHLVAVKAAARVGRGHVEGAALGSRELTFVPSAVEAGDYAFSIGSAGSTGLVLQTILPALLTAAGPSRLRLEGGTHNPLAPSFDFIDLAFAPLIRRMGPRVALRLERPGFYPRGGGVVHVDIETVEHLRPFELLERGPVLELGATAMVANLPMHIAQRELQVIGDALQLAPESLAARRIEGAVGPGNAVTVVVRSERVTEVFSGFGTRGVPAERIAGAVVDEVQRYLAADVAVGVHLADQLLLPLALAGGGCYSTLSPSRHATTNIQVIERFLGVRVQVGQTDRGAWQIALVRVGDP
jgi:RNA 3'-terminal phosphate cyclase (ATP)